MGATFSDNNTIRSIPIETINKSLQEQHERDLSVKVVNESTKRFEKSLTDTETMVERAKSAREAMDVLADCIKVAWIDYSESVQVYINSIRQKKISAELETKQMMALFDSFAKFSNDPQREIELKKLEQFADVCERLSKLNDSGILEKIATIIK
jgi:SOS response regulatory protein OraA/RecX